MNILEKKARHIAYNLGYTVETGFDGTIYVTGYGAKLRFEAECWQEVVTFLDPNDNFPSETSASDISARFNSDCVRVKVLEFEDGIYLESIEVYPPDNRKAGHGTLTMKMIQAYCSHVNKPLYLYASDELGGDLEMLQKWYTKIGMKETIWGRFHGYKYDFIYQPEGVQE